MTRDREDDLPVEGLRERKRRETAERIRETGIRLFMEKGYAATTLEDIAGEAGISRRTFFYYYKSKDDILLTMQNGTGAAVAAALREAPPDKRPFEAVRDAVLRLTASIPHDELIVLDRLMRSSEAARQRPTFSTNKRSLRRSAKNGLSRSARLPSDGSPCWQSEDSAFP